jgi:glycosyltransferase involved in cell wall biosynthesis
MRVLHLLSSTGVHGAETMTLELGRQLRLLGVAPHLALLQTAGPAASEIARHAEVWAESCTVIPCNGRVDLSAVGHLRKILRAQGIDVVHCHGYKPDLYGLLARRGSRVSLIATCHNWLGSSLSMRLYAALDKRVLARFERVVAVSGPVEKELRRYVPAQNVRRIGNGIDTARFAPLRDRVSARKALGLPERTTVGFVGRLTREKGVVTLLRSMARVVVERATPEVQLIIVGSGPERQQLQSEAEAAGLSGLVHFLGERSDLPQLYNAMDMFVLPSLQEGFPMVILEAMAARVPIVATPVGDVAMMLDEGRAGRLIPLNSTAELASALLELLKEPARAHALATTAHARVSARFSSAAMARSYLALYEQAREVRVTDAAAKRDKA